MYVNLVILLVTSQCAVSRSFNYQNTYNLEPVRNYRGHRSVHQTVYFHNVPHREISQNPQMYNSQLTVQTGFQGTRPASFYSISPNWNFQQRQKPFMLVTWPNNFNNIHFHQIRPVNSEIQTANVVNGQVVVETLNGKFEDFIKPDPNLVGPIVPFPATVPPQQIQGSTPVHGTTTPSEQSDWSHLPEDVIHHTSSAPSEYNMHEFTTTAIPTQKSTITSSEQENANNGDEQYDIDVRNDTE